MHILQKSIIFNIFITMTIAQDTRQPAIVIHGGAGTIKRSSMTPEMEKDYRTALQEALTVGYDILQSGGSSMDAVVSSLAILEDSPLFNAGKGSVFTSDGHHEMDASIMDGKTKNAGAIAGVKRIKNPILLARTIMEKSPHVMMVGSGAESYAKEQGFSFVENDYFFTQKRYDYWQKVKEGNSGEAEKHGTVGCVALDMDGNLCAGTSTGGMTDKHYGRVGDSPIIGAGTFADNSSCGVSATGHGEYFMRSVVAHQISNKMSLQGVSVDSAARSVIHEDLAELGGTGGVIAMDQVGNISMPFNTEGMYRGYINTDGEMKIFIYNDE